jgi:hypothetical protein
MGGVRGDGGAGGGGANADEERDLAAMRGRSSEVPRGGPSNGPPSAAGSLSLSLAVDGALRRKLLDAEAKIREDPIFAIKRAEMQGLKEIFSNPLKMRLLQKAHAEITTTLETLDGGDRKVKKEKHHKRHKKHKKRRRSRSSSGSSSSGDERPPHKSLKAEPAASSTMKPEPVDPSNHRHTPASAPRRRSSSPRPSTRGVAESSGSRLPRPPARAALTAEERDRRLREMESTARDVERRRGEHLEEHRRKIEEEEAALRKARGRNQYIDKERRNAIDNRTVGEAIKDRRYYLTRDRDSD